MEYLRIKVIPKSSKNEIVGIQQDETEFGPQTTIRIKIKAAPEKGKANKELIEFLSEALDISKQQITIISGHTSQLKLLKINIPNLLPTIDKLLSTTDES